MKTKGLIVLYAYPHDGVTDIYREKEKKEFWGEKIGQATQCFEHSAVL